MEVIMANSNVILHWNCRGLKGNRIELEILMAEYKPAVICLQETLLDQSIEIDQNNTDSLPNYVQFKGYKGYFKCLPSGRNGIAIYVKNNILHTPIKLTTCLQALAVRITFQGKEFIVSNHYTSNLHDGVPSVAQFDSIINKFDKPYIMCGDFNAHNTLWSHPKNNKRGEALEQFMYKNDLTILNSDVKTHLNNTTKEFSLLDLSIVHPALYLDFEAKVVSDPHGSDHFPVIVTFNGTLLENDRRSKWNFKRADWSSFKVQCENEITNDLFDPQEDEITVFTEKLLEIAAEHIPMTSPFNKKCSKPWFDEDCKSAKRERNRANNLNRRKPCVNNAIKAKIATARAKRIFKKKKTRVVEELCILYQFQNSN